MIDNRDKVNAVIEDAATPSNVRSTLQDLLAVSDYIDSVDVDDDGNVSPKDDGTATAQAAVNAESSTGQATAPAEVPAAEGNSDATATVAQPPEAGPTGDGESSSPAPGVGESSSPNNG